MSRSTTRLAAIVCALCVTSACSKSRANSASAATADPSGASAPAGADTGALSLDCGKVFSPNDAAGLLNPPVTVQAVPGSASWCALGSADLADITVRTGNDDMIQAMWNEATLSSEHTKFAALPGVGDQAVFKAGGHGEVPEVASKKGNVYCIVDVAGGSADGYKSLAGAEVAKRLGALCNKAFAALRA